jgi:hypothetical protein
MKDSDLRGITTEGLIEELERRQVSFEKYKEMGSWIAREEELVRLREMTNYKESAANYKELREATTELLKAIDGLFPTDGPVKARVRAALKEKE